MAKKKEEKEDQVYTARVSDLEMFLVVMALTPIVDPEINQHPSDPDCIWGPGVNMVGLNATRKSSLARSVGRRTGLGVWVANAPTKQPDDFGGVVVPTAAGIVLECILPPARAAMAAGGGILIIDEISDALPAVQAALHSIPVERRVGDHPLPSRTRNWTCMNPIEYATVGHAIGSGLGSRYAHVWVDPPTRLQWSNWLEGNMTTLMRAEVGEQVVSNQWNTHWPQTVALAGKYMGCTKDETLHNQPKPDDPRAGGPWPNPRGWHYFCCARTALKCLDGPPALELEIMETLLGPSVTTEWSSWTSKADLPTIEEILKGQWKLDRSRPDRTYMIVTQLCEHMKAFERADRATAVQQAIPAWKQVHRLLKEGVGDLTVRPGKILALANLGPDCDNADVAQASSAVIHDMTSEGFTPFAQ
jgi:hypothetical protein